MKIKRYITRDEDCPDDLIGIWIKKPKKYIGSILIMVLIAIIVVSSILLYTGIETEEIIEEVEDMHPYKESGNRDSYSQYNEGWADACDILGEAIKALLGKEEG